MPLCVAESSPARILFLLKVIAKLFLIWVNVSKSVESIFGLRCHCFSLMCELLRLSFGSSGPSGFSMTFDSWLHLPVVVLSWDSTLSLVEFCSALAFVSIHMSHTLSHFPCPSSWLIYPTLSLAWAHSPRLPPASKKCKISLFYTGTNRTSLKNHLSCSNHQRRWQGQRSWGCPSLDEEIQAINGNQEMEIQSSPAMSSPVGYPIPSGQP